MHARQAHKAQLNTIHSAATGGFREVCGWQTINCLELCATVLFDHADKQVSISYYLENCCVMYGTAQKCIQ